MTETILRPSGTWALTGRDAGLKPGEAPASNPAGRGLNPGGEQAPTSYM
jgi:hypothetical protein